MCILCVIQKWSRRIATMLPWLVIPLIVLWAISQLLPPAFRFEITSPRLACVLVLLVTLFWYEVLMPKLSAWRIRRNARLRERKRFEAIEMQKLKKTATRRCRNCLTAYRDQNPGGGKFMCSYCGHISKRPVLDLPMHPVIGNSGILKELVGKGGKIMNGKGWSDNRWMCGQDWMENGNWGGGTFAGNSNYWSIGGGLFGGYDDHCLAEKSYSCIFIFAYRAVTSVFLFIVWVWRKIFRISSFRDDASADADRQGMLDNRGDNGGSGQESRGEKARRKAEEKRQARLEKELLEEEERKQREEVTRLVEERRRLRDKKIDAEKDCGKDGSPQAKARESKKEAERKRQERRKERDKGSSKSNSDAEELEKRAGNRNYTNEREQHSSTPNSVRTHGTEVRHGFKGADVGLHSRGNAGTRYFDRMRGTFLSSSRAFTGAGFFGKGTNASAVSRDHKPCGFVGNGQSSTHRKEIPERVPGLSTVNGDDKSANHPVFIEPQQNTAPKKSWQQLFTRSSTGSPLPSNPNVICKPTGNHNVEVQNQPDSDHPTLTQSFDNPINFGLGNPFSLPSFSIGSSSDSSSISSISSGAMQPKVLDSSHKLLPEELEIFEDPCYVPDPISLLGPVSESLDNFQLDQGFATDPRLEKPGPVKTIAAPSVVTKPSPIQSPLSRSRVCVSEGQARDNNSNNTTDNGSWQMWNSSPLGQDGLGIVGGPVIDWHMYPEMNLPRKEDNTQSVPRKTMASLFKKDEQAIPSCYPSQNVLFGHAPNDGAFNTSLPSNVDDPWLPRTLFGPSIGQENKILLKPEENGLQNGLICGNFNGPVSNQQFDLSAPYSWPKKDGIVKDSRDDAGNSLMGTRPHIGGLYTPSDVQSLW